MIIFSPQKKILYMEKNKPVISISIVFDTTGSMSDLWKSLKMVFLEGSLIEKLKEDTGSEDVIL